jgi:outer membrane protein OmpA-like peptidoglycan-associated protein
VRNFGSVIIQGASTIVAGLLLAAGTGCSADSGSTPSPSPTPTAPVRVAGSVVATAGSTNEMDVVVPEEISARWTALGSRGTGVELVQVGGDGRASRVPVDLTGDTAGHVAGLGQQINARDATSPGRSALAGMDAVKSPAGAPVWVFSPLLDTKDPLSFTELAFDESPNTVVKSVRRAGRLPKLQGREVTFVVTPVAGEQKKLSALQVGYQHAVWEGLARAGGAKKVTFFVGTGTTPGAGTIPAVPIPDPNDKIDAQQTDAKTTTCTLPSPALFVSDQAKLIDKQATLKALKACLPTVDSSTRITVEGHTSGVSGADNAFTKSLSVRRATEVAALLRELKVPAKNIAKVTGYGSSRPLVKPSSNPKNRAVVVTFTSTGAG